MELNKDDLLRLEELDRLYSPINYKGTKLPERGRAYDTYSFLLYLTIKGNPTYKRRLENYVFNLYKKEEGLINELIGCKTQLKRKILHSLELLIHTIAHIASIPGRDKYVSISLRKADYSNNKSYFHALSYKAMSTAVYMLKDALLFGNQSYIELKKGTFDRIKNEGLRSRIEPTSACLDDLISNNLIFPGHPYGLKKNQKKARIDQSILQIKKIENAGQTEVIENLIRPLSKLESILPIMNDKYRTLKIDFKIESYKTYIDTWDYTYMKSRLHHMSGNALYRRFVGEDGSSGRIYGHWVQNCPSILRQHITFNGQNTIEKDYASMQLMLLYGLAKISPPNGDLYEIEGQHINRTWMKLVLSKSIGARDRFEALASLRKEMKQFAFILLKYAETYFDLFWEKHKKVYPLLFKGELWKELQFADSNIALNVLAILNEKGIIAIPIHDSFIVQQRYETELIEAMNTGFKEYFPNVRPIIK